MLTFVMVVLLLLAVSVGMLSSCAFCILACVEFRDYALYMNEEKSIYRAPGGARDVLRTYDNSTDDWTPERSLNALMSPLYFLALYVFGVKLANNIVIVFI
jgi:hypothetical protein